VSTHNPSLFFAILLLASGCSTTWTAETKRLWEALPVPIDKPSQSATANVGEFMFTSWNLSSVPEMETAQSVRFVVDGSKKMMGAIKAKSYNFEVEVPHGRAVLEWMDDSGNKYFKSKELIKVIRGDQKLHGIGGFAIIRNSPAKAYAFWVPYFLPGYALLSDSSTAFEILPGKISSNEFSGFGQTITYLGLVGGELRFVYKEFDGRTIRQAFTQEFSADYEKGREYSYKSAKFVVHDVSPNTINFTVIHGFQ
jgi:hypothetical protein